MQISIEKHIHNLLFTKRRYDCKVISRSNHAIYIQLNKSKIITLFRYQVPQYYAKLINVNPNPITAVFIDKLPDFFIENDEFEVCGGKLYTVGAPHVVPLQYKLHKTKNIKSIKFKKLNKEYIDQINSYLKNAPDEGMKSLDVPSTAWGQARVKLLRNFTMPDPSNPDKFFDALCEIAGAGPGLTPSTDDFICGVISVLKILNYKIPFMKISRQILKRTTKISWYYIVLAMMGYAADWQYEILNNVGARRSRASVPLPLQKISYGHTSGNDWLYGVNFVLKLLKR